MYYSYSSYSPTIGFVQPGSRYYYYPPDNALATSGTSILMSENSSISWGQLTLNSTSLSGYSQQTLNSFFAPLSPYGQVFDPRVVYDSVNNRYIVIADETNTSHSKSNILVAVSKTSNPADGFYFESINSHISVGRQGTWADYPTLAFDGSHIVISTNQFTSSGVYKGSYQYTLNDFSGPNGGLFNGGSSSFTTTAWGSSYSSVQEVSDAGAGTFGVSYVGNTLNVRWTPTSGSSVDHNINLGLIDAGSSLEYTAAQPGSTWKLDAGDGRVTSTAYFNGKLFAVFEVNTGTTLVPVPVVHWVELNATTFQVIAQGNIALTGQTTFNPSIAVDGNGDAIINFTASGPNNYAADYFAVMAAGDSSFSAPVMYQSSINTAYTQGSNNVSRWGDYSTAVADPLDPSGFWISNEYVVSATSWGTALDHVTLSTTAGQGILSPASATTSSPSVSGSITVAAMSPEGDIPDAIWPLFPNSHFPFSSLSHFSDLLHFPDFSHFPEFSSIVGTQDMPAQFLDLMDWA